MATAWDANPFNTSSGGDGNPFSGGEEENPFTFDFDGRGLGDALEEQVMGFKGGFMQSAQNPITDEELLRIFSEFNFVILNNHAKTNSCEFL
jgi:hypothetical protein